jgi:hypothetical protein
MHQEHKEGFEEEGADETQAPGNVGENNSITEFIENMDFVHLKTFQGIPPEEMAKYQNDEFWYVVDETTQLRLAHRVKRKMEPVTYLFQEKEDAETWRYIGSKSGTHQDHKLSVEGEIYSSILKALEVTLGEFDVLPISHAEAQNVFENYPEIKLTREVEERRKLNRDSEEG